MTSIRTLTRNLWRSVERGVIRTAAAIAGIGGTPWDNNTTWDSGVLWDGTGVTWDNGITWDNSTHWS